MTVTEHPPTTGTCELYYSDGSHGPTGVRWTHQRADGTWCVTNFPFRGHGNGRGEWTIVLAEPLTVTPALLCPCCKARAWLDGATLRRLK